MPASEASAGTVPHGSMRKGTHSCVECRRRKVRCIFSPDDSSSCISCKRKGKACEEQRREHFPPPAGKKTSLKERVAKLEALLESSAIQVDDDLQTQGSVGGNEESPESPNSNGGSAAISSPTAETSMSMTSETSQRPGPELNPEFDPDPMVALFNNPIWQSHGPQRSLDLGDTFQMNIENRVAAKRGQVLEILRSSLISPYLLRDILNATGIWFQGWRPLGPWPVDFTTAANFRTLQDFLLWAYSAESPAVVGLAVLCIAESIRKLTLAEHGYLIQQLPRPPGELFQIYFERVDRLINSDSDFSSSKEGLDCMMMSAKIFQHLGLVKRAWHMFHKVILYGQYLGLHRGTRLPNETDQRMRIRFNAWDILAQADLLLSMTVGLPYGSDAKSVPSSFYGEPGTPMWFQRHVMDNCARVIDRNQMGRSTSPEHAQSIRQDLDMAANCMPQEFWQAPEATKQGKLSMKEGIELITKQFFYYQIRVHCHMPLMIQSIEQPHLEGHREACLDGCRGMLNIYNILRSNKKADLISLIDYQAFLCASLLLLALLGYGSSPRTFSQTDHNPDRDLVSSTLQTLHLTSETSNNFVASQSLEGLQSLFNLSQAESCPAMHDGRKDLFAKIMIPFTGTINISPGEFIQRKHSQSPEVAHGVPNLPCFRLSPENPYVGTQCPYPAPTMTDIPTMNNAIPQYSVLPYHDTHMQSNQPPGPMEAEFTSINFDWNNVMEMNTDDWSWLNDMQNESMGQFM